MTVPTYHLLVIDDSKRDVLLLERALRQADDAVFYVTRMETAQTGLEALSAHAYDLVLLNHELPDMDGLDFLQAKQQRHLATPVIMLSTCTHSPLPTAAMRAGAVDDFAKDQVNSRLLGKAIKQAIEKSRLQTQVVADAARLRELEATVAHLQQQLKFPVTP